MELCATDGARLGCCARATESVQSGDPAPAVDYELLPGLATRPLQVCHARDKVVGSHEEHTGLSARTPASVTANLSCR